ncbi:3-oxo-tetronate kinase [Limibacillus sp. MBR-115]|jgi:uncharacterized protein YgbK (DUF1537 family)|uniref:3-oxo-tetronate kinase n=1 Tax=Limibacillus sp. MBR-115 TaxID=3156465 RepID=UPI0033957108
MPLLLGCIADDFTGATDLANTLVKSGMRTVQINGLPGPDSAAPADAEAIVVALKSRTQPAEQAVADSLAAQTWLTTGGARQILFKYCSTFDSTPLGNIGPVAEALMDRLDADFTTFCPVFPGAGRTLYQGHLFIWDTLLSESSMRNHPLTPMTDANLVRFLQLQTKRKVGLLAHQTVRAGSKAVRDTLRELRQQGIEFIICDALTDEDLITLGHAQAGCRLLTGGSGIAMGLADNFRAAGLNLPDSTSSLPAVSGPQAILSGSCSEATLGQLQYVSGRYPVFRIDPLALARGQGLVGRALTWAEDKLGDVPIVFAASAEPATVKAAQEKLGRMEAGELVEKALGKIAQGLVERGLRRLVVAGGETSGAVVSALGLKALRIGPEIAPGVPATVSLTDPPLAVALKSGNFGGPNFFEKAFEVMP